MTGPPVADGAVLIGEDGRILASGPDHAVPRPEGVPDTCFPSSVLMPGLINTHTHLELTGLGGQLADPDFADWIVRLRRRKQGRDSDAFLAAARRGIREGWAAGVTTVADTGDSGAAPRALDELGGSGTCYVEVFGPHPDQAAASVADLESRLDAATPSVGSRVRLGVSPHAPYSVSESLYRATAALAARRGLPLAVHLAESTHETALVTGAGDGGAFAAQWRARGIPLPRPHRSPVALLEAAGVLGPSTLAIHVVQVDAGDVAILARHGVAVAHCPLSNRRHGHGEAPLRALLDAGVRVGVGTDSEASVDRLDLLAEARAARILAGLDADEALALVTTGAAAALGQAGAVGSLARGGWGDVVAIDLPTRAPVDLFETILASGPGHVAATWVAGREVFRRDGLPD